MVKFRKPFSSILAEEFERTSLQTQYIIMVAVLIATIISFPKVTSLISGYVGLYFCMAGLKYYKIYRPIKDLAFKEKVSSSDITDTEDYLLWAAWQAYTLYWDKHPEKLEECDKGRLYAIIGISCSILV